MLACRIIFLLSLIWMSEESEWDYEGETAPEHWKELFPEACSGHFQSPIDIDSRHTVYNPLLKDFVIFFDPPSPGSKFLVQNNGHAVQVDTVGDFYVSNGGLPNIYSTAQFHFHWGHNSHHGSEHTVDGKAAPIEMHIVNWNSQRFESIAKAATQPGGLAVLGILFKISKEDNQALEPIIKALMAIRDPDQKIKTELPAQSLRAFLPPAPEWYYRYNGSLTTPNCFESVIWTVFKERQTISRSQLHVFRQVLKPKHHRRHKRSLTKETEAEDAVLEELGIMDNPVEKARLRRSLEENMKSHELDGASDPANHDEHSEHQDSGHDSEHPELTHGQNSVESHQDPTTDVEHEDSEDIRHVLVNNFRPVQPLHGRTVYRSFPFFDAPIPEKCSNSPVAVSTEESHAGSFSTKSTLLNLLFSKAGDDLSPLNIKVYHGEKETSVHLPPATDGNSHVEVTLDINANTVVNVTAKDKTTGKEKYIVIESSGVSHGESHSVEHHHEQGVLGGEGHSDHGSSDHHHE